MYPASVERIPLTRQTGKGRSRRITREQGEDQQDGAVTSRSLSQQGVRRRRGVGVEDGNGAERYDGVGVGGTTLNFGRPGGVGLEKKTKGRQWGWTWAGEEKDDIRITIQEGQRMFPPTRLGVGRQAEAEPGISPKDQLESSVRYAESLCNHYERDGLREAIQGIMMDDLSVPTAGPSRLRDLPEPQERGDAYGVYLGGLLALVNNERARVARTLLAFPMGAVGHWLNISPFLPVRGVKPDSRGRRQFVPSHKAVERFPTPILQICTSPVVSSARIDREATALVVRLQTTTHLLNIVPNPSFIPGTDIPPTTSLRAASLSYEDTESRRHVDLAIDPNTWSRMLIVDESGGVWLWWEEKEAVRAHSGRLGKVMNLRKVRSATTGKRHQFFRVAFGSRPGTALVVSEKEAVIIDIDDPAHPSTTLLELSSQGSVFTAVEKTALERGTRYTCLVTTYEVMWVDESRAAAAEGGEGTGAALSWKHELGAGGRDLEVISFPHLHHKDQCTILYSRSRQHALAFHTNTNPLRSRSSPYPVALPRQHTTLLTLPALSTRHHPSLISLSTDGEITSTPLVPFPSAEKAKETEDKRKRMPGPIKAVWNEEMKQLVLTSQKTARTGMGVGEDWEEKAKTRSREMNFRWVWEEINANATERTSATFHPLEFERYLREFDAPLEHLMTAADIARDALSIDADPDLSVRSHLLAPLPLSLHAGPSTLRALDNIDPSRHIPLVTQIQDELIHPPHLLPSSTPIKPPDNLLRTSTDAQTIYSKSQDSFPARPHVNSTRFHSHLIQLAVELRLSQSVLFSEDLSVLRINNGQAGVEEEHGNEGMEDVEDFTRAAAKLSLKETESAKIQFGILTPRRPDADIDDEGRAEDEDANPNRNDDVGLPAPALAPAVGSRTKESEGGDRLQSLTARGLMNDWKLGSDPKAWTWKTWMDDQDNDNEVDTVADGSRFVAQDRIVASQSQSQSRRPIKPLPSPRHSPSHSRSQSQSQVFPPAYNHNHYPNQGYPVPSLLTSSTSLPLLQLPFASQPERAGRDRRDGEREWARERAAFQRTHRSSPSPNAAFSGDGFMGGGGEDDESMMRSSTQVVPGVYGGREKKKKGGKKRVGGF